MAQLKEFSIEEKLGSLIRLQKIDSKLDEIKIIKGELPMEVADLEDELQGLRARQTRIEEEINGVTEFIEERKNAIKDSEALIKKYEKDSENVKNNREFEAINKETEMQQLEIKLAEKHIKDANEEIADKVILLDKAKKNIGTKEGSLEIKKAELEKIIVANEKEEKQFSKSSGEAKSDVDPRLLTSYEKIRGNFRNGLAVVPVVRDACGGCFYSIPPQKQSEIKQHKKIIACENCGRILVDEELSNNIEI
ncbi:MAG TPA: C4-type zinc ribbon domain-containing protein [Niabella sp.]|nr:C4-type zinc ribbon domain-containing protein [Niabella sp.]HOZ97379.1 C4-type zinc ribbon domain-containing protein [Niabella sp.]HQW15253.1 C4-type zinc ribbon domain-containing protein [Niabella sp.]HQX20279.1 C4-type zinc ribbon domain-containing protein [Niabella sp.]HQX42432.1 C4-type zinc ribbon domain-containing protein [Niabella sp.]